MERVVVPIAKKRNAKKVEEHRGITLMIMLCKIYATLLAKNLRKEVEKKKIIQDNQAGFREGRGVRQPICAKLFDRKENKKERRKNRGIICGFEAVFDTVDRKKLYKEMDRKEVRGSKKSIERQRV